LDKNPIIEEFTSLIERHQGIIHKVSRIYCNGDACREDLFQDILMQLWKSFPNYDRSRKITTWMYRIALNTAISQYRKDSKVMIDPVDKMEMNIPDDQDEGTEDERIKTLHSAINRLSKAEKSVIILYMDDYPYEEISEIIGISVSNVGVKINQIKKKLQEILKELGYGV